MVNIFVLTNYCECIDKATYYNICNASIDYQFVETIEFSLRIFYCNYNKNISLKLNV